MAKKYHVKIVNAALKLGNRSKNLTTKFLHKKIKTLQNTMSSTTTILPKKSKNIPKDSAHAVKY